MHDYRPAAFTFSSLIAERGWEIPENHLVEIWNREAYPGRTFRTTAGEEITIVSTGRRNEKGGPDFAGACIRIAGNLKRGDIELHRSAGEWVRHGHHLDSRYHDVILHVVLRRPLGRERHSPLTAQLRTVALEEQIVDGISRTWLRAISDAAIRDGTLPCAEYAGEVPLAVRSAMIELLAASRFRRTCGIVRKMFDVMDRPSDAGIASSRIGSTQSILYFMLCDALGYGGNRAGMQALAHRLPLSFWLEAGIAGAPPAFRYLLLLHTASLNSRTRVDTGEGDPDMAREVKILLDAFSIDPLPGSLWQYGGIRPGNAPHRRLATLAAMIPVLLDRSYPAELGNEIVRSAGAGRPLVDGLELLLARVSPPGLSGRRCPGLGRQRVHEIIINVLAPLFHVEGIRRLDPLLAGASLTLYFSFSSAARNAVTLRMRRELEPSPEERGSVQQGSIELFHHYCASLRCGECLIGNHPL